MLYPELGPFNQLNFHVAYNQDVCPKTLEYLARTVNIFMAVDRSHEDLMELAATVKRVADALN